MVQKNTEIKDRSDKVGVAQSETYAMDSKSCCTFAFFRLKSQSVNSAHSVGPYKQQAIMVIKSRPIKIPRKADCDGLSDPKAPDEAADDFLMELSLPLLLLV